MKLVGYIRVSSESQSENTSLSEQKRKIEAYCFALGHELVAVFEEVGSGKDAGTRPQFQLALQKVCDEAEGIIATKLDRIARNTRDVLCLVEDVLQPQNKALVLLDLNVDTSTPIGKMILTMMAAVASLERETINERTQGGRKAKADRGGYSYGSPKYGLKSVDGELVAHDDEQKVIDIIRRHRRSGKSLQEVADWLNSQGIATKQNKQWSSQQIKRICDRLKSAK